MPLVYDLPILPRILLIETATNICSVAIAQGEQVVAACASIGDHAAQITLLIEACLTKAGITANQLNAVAVSTGPGSYTSLRVGTSAAKGMCYALDIPLIAVDTLSALALAAQKQTPADFYIPMIDARRMEVYTKVFDTKAQPITEQEAKIITPESFDDLLDRRVVFCGDGAPKCRETFTQTNATFLPIECQASHLAPLAVFAYTERRFEDVAYYTPNYLKPPNITTPKVAV